MFALRIHGEVAPLPQGIAVAVRRSSKIDGLIVVVISEASHRRYISQPNVLMKLFCNAMNRLLDSPDGDGPIEIPEPRSALAS